MRQGVLLALTVLMTGILACGEAALAKEKNKQTVTVADFNIFHGIDCAAALGDTTQCRLAERIDLLFAHLVAIGCPDIVTLQEVLGRTSVEILTPQGQLVMLDVTSALQLITDKLKPLAEMCGFAYEFLYAADLIDPQRGPLFQGTDEELILSRYPIVQKDILLLHSALYVPDVQNLQFFARHVLLARINHPVGPIDVFTTHLAASEDFGDNTCDSLVNFPAFDIAFHVPCPIECAGAETVRQCEARQVANFVKEHLKDSGSETQTVITGDFNAVPHSAVYKEITKAENNRQDRWIDSYLAADNPECNRHTGIGCTAGRDALSGDLENPALNVDERIDYIFVVPSAPELECAVQEKGTGLFADEPNLPCGPSGPICWASDHSGTRVQLSCAGSSDPDRHPPVVTEPLARSTGLQFAED